MKIDVDGIARQLQAKIDSILRNNSRVELYQQIGEVLRSQMIEEQFATLGKYFTNEQWKPLSAGYAARKRAKGRKPIADLQDTGNLTRSFQWKVLPNGVQLSNSADYAEYLHKGTKRMPARPIFPVELELPEETMDEIEDVVKRWLIEQLNR